jgi:hypothetical protein
MFGGIYKCSRLHSKDGRIGNREGVRMNILIIIGFIESFSGPKNSVLVAFNFWREQMQYLKLPVYNIKNRKTSCFSH